MPIWEMKIFILEYYQNASEAWKRKVKHFMPDNQIIAIYHSILRREERKKKEAENDKKYHQMTIFEWEKIKDVV